MQITDPILAAVAGWVGRSFAELPCWELIREANKLRQVHLPNVTEPLELPGSYYEALFAGLLVPIYEPEPWAIVPMREFQPAVVTHVGLLLSNDHLIHSHASSNVSIEPLRRHRIWNRIVREPSAPTGVEPRRVFLRLK